MKLTDQIKEKIERADSKEKKQDILNDDSLLTLGL